MRHGTAHGYSYYRCRCDACRKVWNEKQAMLRLLRVERPIPDGVKHGTLNAYDNYSCRCDPCRAEKARVNRRYYRGGA